MASLNNVDDLNPLDVVVKPIEHIHALIEALSPLGSIQTIRARTKLPFEKGGEKFCYLLTEGFVSIQNNDNDLVVSLAVAPAIVGISEFLSEKNFHHLYGESKIQVLAISESSFKECMERKPELWIDVAFLLAYYLQRMALREHSMLGKNAYTVIRNAIYTFMSEPEELRANLPLAKYIQNRTALSRSITMMILRHLRFGGYITLERGYLVSINSHLPAQF